ncbi:MAG: hypothetical protein HYU03_05385 [Thaumarchaeota archaeon]|nr:hypothetical protein [Nitrososphaerota archaeon]
MENFHTIDLSVSIEINSAQDDGEILALPCPVAGNVTDSGWMGAHGGN